VDFAWSLEAAERACPQPAGTGGRSRVSDIGAVWGAAEQALGEERFEQAAKIYARLAQTQPECAPALWNRTLALAYSHPDGSAPGIAVALSAAPSVAAGRLLLAAVRVLNGDSTGAEADLRAADAELKVGDAGAPARDALWTQAMVAWGAGEPHRARQPLARLAELQPESAAVWFELGGVALDEARACSRRLSVVAPDSVWNRRLQAEALQTRYPGLAQSLREGSPEASKESGEPPRHDDSLSVANASPEELYRQTREALSISEMAYGRASASARFQAYLHAMKALAAEQQDDEPAAMREYNLGLAQDPKCALLHAGLGHVYRRRMDLPAAEGELEQAWRLDPSDPLVAFELGDTEQRLGKTQPALDLLNHALELDGGLLVARWSRAKAYLTLGDNERALADLEAAVPVDSSGELQWQLARLYRKLGRADLASQAEKRSEDQRAAAALKLETRGEKH
jgi:tetratricopeptide (TPR) repeat protein